MDTLSKSKIESALAARLPSYQVTCTLHADGTLSAVLSGPETDHFAITGIVPIQPLPNKAEAVNGLGLFCVRQHRSAHTTSRLRRTAPSTVHTRQSKDAR
ncbi:hypothetical protein [Pseudomonas sp. RA_5y_Pfl1_P24]|uniref:hypothetical protein n=1 Tax=unclassified Pseudomonas TaxID=196821 RepID=UPI00403F8B1C